jgi:hypothetical protein
MGDIFSPFTTPSTLTRRSAEKRATLYAHLLFQPSATCVRRLFKAFAPDTSYPFELSGATLFFFPLSKSAAWMLDGGGVALGNYNHLNITQSLSRTHTHRFKSGELVQLQANRPLSSVERH